MRVTERGQVTIPKTIREQFGFGANTEVEFVVREGRLELVPVGKSRCKKNDAIYGVPQGSVAVGSSLSGRQGVYPI